jgi:inhibitor of KinA
MRHKISITKPEAFLKLTPLTDSSIILAFGNSIDMAVNRRVHALATRLAFQQIDGVIESVPAYATLTVHYDPLRVSYARVADWLLSNLDATDDTLTRPARRVEVPVSYDGPDLGFVCDHCRLTLPEMIRLHTGSEYTVFMMGFTPGFPYLGTLPEALRVPRLSAPRQRVPAGMVAIAGSQTGIYPMASPGGWQLIGHTDLPLLNIKSEEPFLFVPGDVVRFYATKPGAA